MAIPTSFYAATWADNTTKKNGSPETASFRIPIATLTAGNLVAKTTLIDDLKAAILAVLIGNLAKDSIIQHEVLRNILPASNILAQRENKLLLRYHDITTFSKGRISLPTFDLSQLPAHEEFLDLTAGVGSDLKTAFDAIVVGDDDGHAAFLDSAQFVGRNT